MLGPLMKFTELNLLPEILKAVKDKGYTEPTPIQAQAIPAILDGRDVLGSAQTGTGKTAAFSIPMLQTLSVNKSAGNWHKGIKALIVTPTRELAIQIDESFGDYGKGLGIKHAVIFGGVKQHSQVRQLKGGVDVLIATPGRLLDLMNQGFVKLDGLRIFTLDEADRMLDMGFIHDIKKIIAKIPKQRQSLFFSATMPPNIVALSDTLLTNPVQIKVAVVSSAAESVEQKLYLVDKQDKRSLLTHLLKDDWIASAIVFTRTKYGADKLSKYIKKAGIASDSIHGDKSQNARQRALKSFKEKRVQVLVATDVAARGIDIDELSHVINFEIPNEPETYVHRIGRTGRGTSEGIALSFADKDEHGHIRGIHKLIGKEIPIVDEHPYHRALKSADDLAGHKPSGSSKPKHKSRGGFKGRGGRSGFRGKRR